MDGFELTQAIRKIEKEGGHRLPIIAITASTLEGEIERCFESGMDDFLAKPLEMQKFKAVLKKWMPAETTPSHEGESIPELSISEAADNSDGPIDPHALKSVFGDDPDTFKEILQDFVGPATSNIGEIETAFAERSADGVAKAAHKLKSSARSVGATELADLCLALETAGKADNWNEIEKAEPRLSGVMDSVAQYVESL